MGSAHVEYMNETTGSYPFPRDGALNRVNTIDNRLSTRNIESPCSEFSDAIKRTDPRWILACRIQLVLSSSKIISQTQRVHFKEVGASMGFSPMHVFAIVGIVQRSQTRGGLDSFAMNELLGVPESSRVSSNTRRIRIVGFLTLCVWSISIAILMQLV